MGLRKEGHRAGSQGCMAARAICPSVNTHSGTHVHIHKHRHARAPSELNSHGDSHTCPDGLRDTKEHPCNHTHTHKYKGTLRHVNARCPHKHAQVPVRSHEPLHFCFLPCSKRWNTASGWIAEAGRDSPATKPAGPCLTLPSAPLGQSWASVCLPRHPGQALEGRGRWWVAGRWPAPSSLICDPA